MSVVRSVRAMRPQRARQASLALALFALVAARAVAAELSIAVSRSPLSLPLYVAQKHDLFAAEGLVVRLQECLGGHRCIRDMLDGRVALATSSEMPVMLNSLTDADFVVVVTFATSKRDVKIVARRSAGVDRPADLAGKRVATFPGTSAHYFLDLFLLFHGVDPRSVTTVFVTPEQIVGALLEGRVDAIASFEPFAFRARRALGSDAAVLPGAAVYTETFNLSARRRLVAEREPDLVKLMRALGRAQRLIAERPGEAQTLLRERLGEDASFVAATWPDFDYRLSLDQPLISTLEGQARWALREGHVPRASRIPNFLRAVAPEPLRRADPAAVTLLP